MGHPRRSLSTFACLFAVHGHGWGSRARPQQREGRDWRGEMRRVHARFHGRPGTFAHFGDSITETLGLLDPPEARPQGRPTQDGGCLPAGRGSPATGMLAGLEGPGIRQPRRPDDPMGRGKRRCLAGAAQPGGRPGHVRHERPTRPGGRRVPRSGCGRSSGDAWTAGRL